MVTISRRALFSLFVLLFRVTCLAQSVIEETLSFESAREWLTAADLPGRFREDDLWSTRHVPFAELAGGAVLVEAPRKSGRFALRWADHPRFPTLHTRAVPRDWSSHSAIALWIHSAEPTGQWVTVGIASDSEDTRWHDFMMCTFAVDWQGWRHVRLSFADFTPHGRPVGWNRVDGLYFFTKAFSHQPHPGTVLCLDDCRLLSGEAPATSVKLQQAETPAGLPISGQIPAFDFSVLNHGWPEMHASAAAIAPIQYEPYFKTERALFGYYPRFQPGFVSFSPDGTPFVLYGSCIIQTVDATGRWHVRDLVREVLEPYARRELGFAELGLGDSGQGNEVTIRFDADGDAYLLAYVQDPTKDWRSRTGLLLHSRDNLATWDVHRLPTYFARFEKIVGHNLDCLARPPLILLSKYFAPTTISILLPEKQADGRLRLPAPVTIADEAMPFLPHSGEANQALTHGDTVYLVYGQLKVLPGHSVEDGVPNYIVAYDMSSRRLSDPVLVGFGGRNAKDNHNWATLAADSRGHLHVIVNGHHDPFVYVRSREPWRIDAWTEPESVARGTTYGGLVIDDEDTLYSVTRCSHPGYYFRLTLHRKRSGQPWEPSRHLVLPFKPYYKLWIHKLVIDPVTQRLFLSYYSQSPSICVFRDEFEAYTYIWPDREKRFLTKEEAELPIGTYRHDPRKYAFFSPPAGEMCILVSSDRGETWRLATTETFMPRTLQKP